MPTWLNLIARLFISHGAPLYLVGGAVRNIHLGLPVEDYDLCGPLSPEEVELLCKGSPVTPIGKISSFGTIGLVVKDQEGRHLAEYTTFRKEEYQGGHRPSKVTFTPSLAQDSLRRDFSVNALYLPLLADGFGPVIDPTGGLCDLKNKRLHTVTQAPLQILKDDGLRILRLVRFACDFNLTPSKELLITATQQVSLLGEIAPERLRQELEKILVSDFRYPQLSHDLPPLQKAVNLLNTIGCYPYLFPFCPIDPQGERACVAYKVFHSSTLAHRICLLFWGHSLGAIKQNLQFLRFSNKTTEQILSLAQALAFFTSLTIDELHQPESLWLLIQSQKETALALPLLFGALSNKEKATAIDRLLTDISARALPWSLRELAVNGHDLLPLVKGKADQKNLGALLNNLHKQVVVNGLANTQPALIAKAKEVLL